MKKQELVEQLADKEHASWARWQAYLHSLCEQREDGALIIPADRVAHWEHEIATPYAELPEEYKQFDRDEVQHILPIIAEYTAHYTTEWATEYAKAYGTGMPVNVYLDGRLLAQTFVREIPDSVK